MNLLILVVIPLALATGDAKFNSANCSTHSTCDECLSDAKCIGAASYKIRCVSHSEDIHDNETEILVRECCPDGDRFDQVLCGFDGHQNNVTVPIEPEVPSLIDVFWIRYIAVGFLFVLVLSGAFGVTITCLRRRKNYHTYSKIRNRRKPAVSTSVLGKVIFEVDHTGETDDGATEDMEIRMTSERPASSHAAVIPLVEHVLVHENKEQPPEKPKRTFIAGAEDLHREVNQPARSNGDTTNRETHSDDRTVFSTSKCVETGNQQRKNSVHIHSIVTTQSSCQASTSTEGPAHVYAGTETFGKCADNANKRSKDMKKTATRVPTERMDNRGTPKPTGKESSDAMKPETVGHPSASLKSKPEIVKRQAYEGVPSSGRTPTNDFYYKDLKGSHGKTCKAMVAHWENAFRDTKH